MTSVSDQITAEMQVLISQDFCSCWRIGNMQIFEFGKVRSHLNRKGQKVQSGEFKLHVQCRWRMINPTRILFGRDDLLRPADSRISIDDFDWDESESILDVAQQEWFTGHRPGFAKVTSVSGDAYGGCRIGFGTGEILELIPCDSDRSEYSEHWRLFGHRDDDTHFVVTGAGIDIG